MFLSNKPILDGTYIYDKINKKIETGNEINIYEQFYIWSFHNRTKVLFWLFILLIIILIINDVIEYRNNNFVILSQSGGNDNNKARTFKTTNLSVRTKRRFGKITEGITDVGDDISKGAKSISKGIKNVFIGKNTGEDMNKVAMAAQKFRSSFAKNISFRKNRDPSQMSNYELQRIKELEAKKAERKYKTFGEIKDFVTFFPLIDKFFSNIWNLVTKTKAGVIIGLAFLVYGFGAVVIPLIIIYLFIKFTLNILRRKAEPYKKFRRYKKNIRSGDSKRR